eukprot:CAMPEP_0184290940 /NCGR_PEP_ID=MMETSP1049-20130417/3073_1 /TAXON_ID=77928 /ORGANISM="Proteomonas sulcata, Strain CCMP704" /LENGTH=122 /DNA_ID=CAMNT_0026598231 /DNA_START=425 /DNA_END=793 /DNA_ORIENTATION=+
MLGCMPLLRKLGRSSLQGCLLSLRPSRACFPRMALSVLLKLTHNPCWDPRHLRRCHITVPTGAFGLADQSARGNSLLNRLRLFDSCPKLTESVPVPHPVAKQRRVLQRLISLAAGLIPGVHL